MYVCLFVYLCVYLFSQEECLWFIYEILIVVCDPGTGKNQFSFPFIFPPSFSPSLSPLAIPLPHIISKTHHLHYTPPPSPSHHYHLHHHTPPAHQTCTTSPSPPPVSQCGDCIPHPLLLLIFLHTETIHVHYFFYTTSLSFCPSRKIRQRQTLPTVTQVFCFQCTYIHTYIIHTHTSIKVKKYLHTYNIHSPPSQDTMLMPPPLQYLLDTCQHITHQQPPSYTCPSPPPQSPHHPFPSTLTTTPPPPPPPHCYVQLSLTDVT